MLETVDVGFQPAPDFFETVRMRHYRQVVRMSLLDHGFDLFLLHQILIDELDDIHAGCGQFPDFVAGILDPVYSPAKILGAGIGRMLNKRTGYIQRGPGDFAPIDPITYGDDGVQWRSQ